MGGFDRASVYGVYLPNFTEYFNEKGNNASPNAWPLPKCDATITVWTGGQSFRTNRRLIQKLREVLKISMEKWSLFLVTGTIWLHVFEGTVCHTFFH